MLKYSFLIIWLPFASISSCFCATGTVFHQRHWAKISSFLRYLVLNPYLTWVLLALRVWNLVRLTHSVIEVVLLLHTTEQFQSNLNNSAAISTIPNYKEKIPILDLGVHTVVLQCVVSLFVHLFQPQLIHQRVIWLFVQSNISVDKHCLQSDDKSLSRPSAIVGKCKSKCEDL